MFIFLQKGKVKNTTVQQHTLSAH